MKKILWLLVFSVTPAFCYVPPVESLLRNGANPDLTSSGVALSFSVKRIPSPVKSESSVESSLSSLRQEDFYRLFFTRVASGIVKVAQTRYRDSSFSEVALEEKLYFSNFTPYTIKAAAEDAERGIFQGLIRSIALNDGEFLIQYLKNLGLPLKLNSEIINRQKVEYLAEYKNYLFSINKDRSNRRGRANPLKPEDAVERERVDQVMREPMYVDQGQVKIARESGEMVWSILAGSFEAIIDYKKREIQKIKFKSDLGELEILCSDYWLANGTHSVPRQMMIKDFKGDYFKVEIINLQHYPDKEATLVSRLKKWDSILKGKKSLDPKPPFLL